MPHIFVSCSLPLQLLPNAVLQNCSAQHGYRINALPFLPFKCCNIGAVAPALSIFGDMLNDAKVEAIGRAI